MSLSPVNRFVVISGCSGGGKSTLLAELAQRGYVVVEEPGRRIVRAEVENRGTALPWIDLPAFLRQAIAMALADRDAVRRSDNWVFFDRGIVDAAVGLQHLTGEPVVATLGHTHRYHQHVFLTPPWPEIYVQDPERRHGIDSATSEYFRLLETYSALGYEISILSKVDVTERADFVLGTLDYWRSR
ncbi:AAA family ATPase [Pseudomonas jinjuensis]|uniref:AAA family ATPase n=1 Tax=Pseudomonas jinjuensis TaxID=198616 RepID=UPI000A00404E|nr:AAA family ATPase [Pseudomonas jinjuensis]